MTWAEILLTIKAAADAFKSGADLTAEVRKDHAEKLDAAFAAVVEHQKRIELEGPALPPGPIQKGA